MIDQKFKSDDLKIVIMNISPNEVKDLVSEKSKKKYLEERMDKIDSYAEKMENGEWDISKEYIKENISWKLPIIFFQNGKLWEGKHRILALSKLKDKVIPFVCILGWDEKRFRKDPFINSEQFIKFKEDAVKSLIKHKFKDTKLDDIK